MPGPLLAVSVPGRPRPQGSLRLMGVSSAGRPMLRNPDATVAHRNLVVGVLAGAWAGREALVSAVAVRCRFVFARPASHYGTGRNAAALRPSAPARHRQVPDLDKLLRLVGDALVVAGVLGDDAQVCVWRGEKLWGDSDGTSVEVWEADR